MNNLEVTNNTYHKATSVGVLEEEILAIWKDVFEYSDISISDSFYELGGDSIKAIQIVSQLRNKGIQISSQDLFDLSTIRRLAEKISTEMEQVTLDESKILNKINLIKFEIAQGCRFHERIEGAA